MTITRLLRFPEKLQIKLCEAGNLEHVVVVIDLPLGIQPHLDADGDKDDRGRTWREQLAADSVALYEPFVDLTLVARWTDQRDVHSGTGRVE